MHSSFDTERAVTSGTLALCPAIASAQHTAAAHNSNLKLKSLLGHPDLACSVRAELIPDGLQLEDVYDITSWFADKSWNALGYRGV